MRNNGRQADSLTVAVLGTGRMAGIHLAALAELRDRGLQVDGRRVSIEPAVYGRDTEKVRAIAAQHRVARTSTRLEELIDASDVDVVDNCLVNSEHFGPLMRAIDSGKHVFTEKPLTIDLGEAERLLAAARKAGVQHGVIQNMRFNPGPRKAGQLIEEGFVGRVFSADVLFGVQFTQNAIALAFPAQRTVSNGGADATMGSVNYYLDGGSNVSSLRNTGNTPPNPDAVEEFRVDTNNYSAEYGRFGNGVIGNCFASWVRRKHEEVPEFQIDGEDGSLLFSFNSLRTQKQAETPLFRFDARQVQAESLADWHTVDLELRDPFGLQLEQFLGGIVRGRPTTPDWEDAVINQRLIKAAYLSATERREVRLEEIGSAVRTAA